MRGGRWRRRRRRRRRRREMEGDGGRWRSRRESYATLVMRVGVCMRSNTLDESSCTREGGREGQQGGW